MPATHRRVTQRDIARLAGVSQATVSLVLNNRADADVRIAPETRDRVLRVIAETGYAADPVARRLATRFNRIIGVFTYEPAFPSGSRDFFHPFLLGIEEYAERVGLNADLPDAVRSTGMSPAHLRVDDLESAVREQLAELAGSLEGTVGIVVPAARVGEVTRWVSSWAEFAEETGSPDSRIVVLSGLDTKGLEFDGLIVVAPKEIESEAPTGKATLYVVYTRATQRMVTLTP